MRVDGTINFLNDNSFSFYFSFLLATIQFFIHIFSLNLKFNSTVTFFFLIKIDQIKTIIFVEEKGCEYIFKIYKENVNRDYI